MSIAVISSVYGGYDTPIAPVPQDVDCDWVLVTDTPVECPPWRVVVEPRPHLHPRMAAKVAKCRPDLYTQADTTVWVDASFFVSAADFVSWAVSHVDPVNPLAQIVHPERRRITAEAAVSATMAKYAGLPVIEQAGSYLTSGYPDDWGLWATGLIVRRHCPQLRGFGSAWLAEQTRWSYQDQISEAPCLWHLDLRPVDICESLWGNPRFVIRGHASHL